jgi:hypothetical protein
MTESILQAYLNEKHIKTDVKENIDSLTKAVNEVNAYLKGRKGRGHIIPFTLVALDPKVKDSDPVMQQVEMIIIKKWPAFKNSVTATKDKSTTYVRAVILESLSQLSKDDADTAALVWLTARDVIRHFQLGSEESVISGLLQELADRTEENGQVAWGISRKLQAIDFKGGEISVSSPKTTTVSQEDLKNSLLRAAQHSGWKNLSNQIGDNPHNFNQHWAVFFSEKAAQGIADTVNAALSQQIKSLSSFSTSIQKSLDVYLAQLQPFLEELNKVFISSITTNNKRSELLWWKQSLYSRSLNTSYRSLDRLNAAICMALDLAEQVDAFYPEIVDYLLRETLKDVYGEKAEEVRLLIDWLKDSNSLHKDIQSELNKHAAIGDERKPLLTAWANVLQSDETANFFTETGIDKKAKLMVSDLAVWLFHGLQAQKLAAAK